MSDINSILYCNEELSDYVDDNKRFQHENSKPFFEMYYFKIYIITIRLYYHRSSFPIPFSNGLLEIRINRFIQEESTLIAILNPLVCYM